MRTAYLTKLNEPTYVISTPHLSIGKFRAPILDYWAYWTPENQ